MSLLDFLNLENLSALSTGPITTKNKISISFANFFSLTFFIINLYQKDEKKIEKKKLQINLSFSDFIESDHRKVNYKEYV
jgi:hypothetical protein